MSALVSELVRVVLQVGLFLAREDQAPVKVEVMHNHMLICALQGYPGYPDEQEVNAGRRLQLLDTLRIPSRNFL